MHWPVWGPEREAVGMAQGKRGKPTYNTLNARLMLQRWIPPEWREEEPPLPAPTETTPAGQCFRRVTAILAGKETKGNQAEILGQMWGHL